MAPATGDFHVPAAAERQPMEPWPDEGRYHWCGEYPEDITLFNAGVEIGRYLADHVPVALGSEIDPATGQSRYTYFKVFVDASHQATDYGNQADEWIAGGIATLDANTGKLTLIDQGPAPGPTAVLDTDPATIGTSSPKTFLKTPGWTLTTKGWQYMTAFTNGAPVFGAAPDGRTTVASASPTGARAVLVKAMIGDLRANGFTVS